MPTNLHNVAAKFFNTPLLLEDSTALTISDYLHKRISGQIDEEDMGPQKGEEYFALGDVKRDGDGVPLGYTVFGNVGIVPLRGELVARHSWMDAYSGVTSYEKFRSVLKLAAEDRSISQIVLDVDSPGGEANGCFETGQFVRAVSKEKPVIAVSNCGMASAAYAVSCGASEIVSLGSSMTGSIGVVIVATSRKDQLEMNGIKAKVIRSGKLKMKPNQFESIDKDTITHLQSRVDQLADVFFNHVAGMRGISASDVEALEGQVYFGPEAQEHGLVDNIATFEDTVESLGLASGRSKTYFSAAIEEETMTANTEERARIGAITRHESAKMFENGANHLAFETDLSAEDATSIMAAFEKDMTAASGSEQISALTDENTSLKAQVDQLTKDLEAEKAKAKDDHGFKEALDREAPGVGASASEEDEDNSPKSRFAHITGARGQAKA